jgi:phosphonate transport system substrate-binding protein
MMATKLLFISLLVLFFFSCKNNTSLERPSVLKVGIYSGDNPIQTKENIKLFQKYLEHELKMPVEFVFTTDYTSLVEGIQRKKLNVAQLSPFAYVLATQKPCLVPLVTIGEHHKRTEYHSFIFTYPSSTINSIEDLKIHAKELTLCFADPASASGHLIPRAYLRSIGLNPETSFKEVIFAGSHPASLLSVKTKKIDIGCSTTELAFYRLIESGSMKKDDLKILWTSEGIINDAICASSDLDPAIIEKIKQAYLDVDKKDPNAFAGSIARYYSNASQMQFVPTYDSLYTGIRKIAENIKELKIIK